MTTMTAAELRRYADAVVTTCLHTKKGDTIAIHGEPGHREFAVALTDAAYRAGAHFVDVLYVDPIIRRARITGADMKSLQWTPKWHLARMKELLASDAALVSITGEADPGLMKGVDPQRAVLEMTARVPGREAYLKAVARGDARFCVVAYPQAGWAKQVYPKLSEERALRALAKDLLAFTRTSSSDQPNAWAKHIETLVARADALTKRRFVGLEFAAPGTDLRVGLAPKTRFLAAEMKAPRSGRRFCANLPTEEVFASPDASQTEGHFTCTRPLSLDGQYIEGIRAEFANGRLVRIRAKSKRHTDYLTAYFARDKGASMLGEVALVDRASRIGQANRTYGMTLLDENAVAHVALGSGFAQSRIPDAKLKGARGVNASRVHVDVMIGCDELNVTGVTAKGDRVPVIKAGTWSLKCIKGVWPL